MTQKDSASKDSGTANFRVIGTRPARHDAADKVMGRAKFGADIKLTGMLRGAILRSPHAHANIRSIDTTTAASLPGVHAVVTGADLPDPADKVCELGEGAEALWHLSRNTLARSKVLYRGHPVAAVAADNIHIAEEAARLIEVDYETLPPVLDVLDAMKPDAPILNDDVRTAQQPGGETGDAPTNVSTHFCFEKGDIERGFATATTIVEREFRTATVHQGYIEPHNATASWDANGRVIIWSSVQGAFSARHQVADVLQIPVGQVRVIPMEVGGAFGGKICVYLPAVAALLSKKARKPVKLVMDRASDFQATGPTPGSYMRIKMGADDEGRIVAAEGYLVFEAGAFPSPGEIACGCMCLFACYDIPNGRIDGYDVCVNKPRSNAYRAPGSTQACYAAESVVDELSEKLGMDPLEFRLKNAAQEGTRRIDGPTFGRIGMRETVEAIQQSEHWNSPLEGPNRGRGVATGFWFNAGLKSSAIASVNADGTVALVEGSTDLHGTRTTLAMQLAETLGISVEDVIPSVGDTDAIGYTDVTGGSRVTFATGMAVIEAGRDIQRQMVQRAATLWNVASDEVNYDAGNIVGPNGQTFAFKELAALIAQTSEPVMGRGSVASGRPAGAYGTHCVDVEVDPETGKIHILRYTASQDVGKAVHPAIVEGQLQGGTVQGIGWALNEEYWYDEHGVMHNPTFLDYRIPTCCDVPMIDTILVEVPDPAHPFGVRGVGETPIVPPPAALANAVYRATGVRMQRLPMSPPRVFHEMQSGTADES